MFTMNWAALVFYLKFLYDLELESESTYLTDISMYWIDGHTVKCWTY